MLSYACGCISAVDACVGCMDVVRVFVVFFFFFSLSVGLYEINMSFFFITNVPFSKTYGATSEKRAIWGPPVHSVLQRTMHSPQYLGFLVAVLRSKAEGGDCFSALSLRSTEDVIQKKTPT